MFSYHFYEPDCQGEFVGVCGGSEGELWNYLVWNRKQISTFVQHSRWVEIGGEEWGVKVNFYESKYRQKNITKK